MHRDKRLGLAMGLLIVAIMGAFFFRLKPTSHDSLPEMAQRENIDNIIEKMPKGPYLAGLEDDLSPIQQNKSKHHFSQNLPQWDVSELFDNQEQMANNNQPNSSLAPNPIPQGSNSSVFSVSQKRIIPSIQDDAKEQHTELHETEMNDDDPFDLPPMDVSLSNDSFPKRNKMFQDENKKNSPSPRASYKARPYRVKEGDTLQKISQKYLGDKNRYQEIYRLNKNKLRTVDDLRTGMLIRIPMIPRMALLENKKPEEVAEPAKRNYHLTIEADQQHQEEMITKPKQLTITEKTITEEKSSPVSQWPFYTTNSSEHE